jgi:2-succinyl-6-hydroxy-2,4-cyclohexadiene-1-carboxylate synthase
MLQAAAGELVAQRAQEHVGVGGGHDPMRMRPQLVLLHGFTHTGASWDTVVAALGERYRVLAPDIRGHGSASELQPATLQAVLADLDRLAPGRFTLAGYSMGGRIALHAAAAPGLAERVERLILVGASPGLADRSERDTRRAADERLADEIEGATIEEFAERWAAVPVLSGQSTEVAAAAHADRLRSTPAGLARALRGLGTGALPSLWERLSALRVPVTLVVGARDQRFRDIADQMAMRIVDASTAVVPGAGHAVHLEAPDHVARIIAPEE